MSEIAHPSLGPGGRLLARADGVFDRIYSSRYNPLLQSGPIAVALLLVLIATGLYLLIFYRIGDPYGSVSRIVGQAWTGRWIRSLHRFASDAALVAIAVHAFRMFVRRRTWGPRALAWVSGLPLVGLFLVIGWTGFVMVWDTQAQLLAEEGARLLDALPFFSEPIARTFLGERSMPGAFFFLNYFLHIAVPLGIGLMLYLHVSRLSRPRMLPPSRLTWALTGLLSALAIAWPAPLGPLADPARLISSAPLDWFPVTRALPGWTVWGIGSGLAIAALAAPVWTRPRRETAPPPSFVNAAICVECVQCSIDCPYDAIEMVSRPEGDARSDLVALVDPTSCVSCGICAGSCAPMGVGPPGRTGRDQLQRVRSFIAASPPDPEGVVLVACSFGAGDLGRAEMFHGASVFPVECAGSLHTSVVEYLVRAGAGGVLVAACPGRDCWNREGPKWLAQRLYAGREADLKPRVDRQRLRYVQTGAAGRRDIAVAVEEMRSEIAAMRPAMSEGDIDIDLLCETVDGPGSELVTGGGE
jgi:coenzyme F420-reducing hydrogenase delta subunit/Pyruvate/2-oxoacid:ferredoxin oxidoreductase delta subunit